MLIRPTRKPAAVIAIGAAAIGGAFFLALVLAPLPPLHRPSSTVIEAKDGTVLRAFARSDGAFWRIPFGSEREPPDHLIAAVPPLEDRRFFHHPGIDPFALARAAIDNIEAGRVVSGGSTLTMQVARMIDPRPRTIGAKAIEAFRALQLELRYSKNELLALYLELAP